MGGIDEETPDTKRCGACSSVKPTTDFYKHKTARKGVDSRCKACKAEYNRDIGAYKLWGRGFHLAAKYGMTLKQFDERLLEQDGKCAICRATEPGGRGGWHVDHNHKTGAVRGILCTHCNTVLGMAKDNPEVLRRAAEYLERGK